MAENDRPSDIVDKAFETLRGSQLPEGPSLPALEQTLQAVHQAQQKSNRISLVERIKIKNRFIKYPVAAAIALAVLAGGAYLLLGPHAGIAFADVRQQIEQAQTMTLTATAERKGIDKPVRMKMYFKSPGLMRQEQELTPEEAGMGSSASQSATSASPQQVVTIFDMVNLKGVSLFLGMKKAIVYELKNVPEETIAKARQQNFLGELKRAVAGEHQELGEKKINGRKAKGYRCRPADTPMVTMDIWVDASTAVPLLVEQALPNGMGMGKVRLTDFVIDPKLEDSLFDTRVPEGYTIETQTLDFKIQESDLSKGLSVLGKVCGGVFPKSLMPTPGLIEQINKSKISAEERRELGTLLMSLQTWAMQGGEFVYVGEGVKLGDKATPILWYKVKGAKMYRVVYGDLRAVDAEKAPKHSAGRPATE